MTALTPIPGDRSTVSRALVALVLAFAVAGAMVAPVTAASASQDESGTIDIERNGDFVDVTLSGFEERPDEVTIAVDASNASTSVTENSSDGTADVAITRLVSEIDHVSLIDANVTVTAGDASDSVTLDLRTIEFATEVPVRVDSGDGSRVVLPLERGATVGLSDGEPIAVSTSGDTVTATVRADGTQLTIGQPELVEATESVDEITLSASVADGEQTERTLEPELRDLGDQLVLWYPLLDTGTTYELAAEDDEGVQYVNNSVEPVRPGEIDLSPLSGTGAVTASVTPESGGEPLLENERVELNKPFSLSATVADDGSAIAINESVDGVAVSAVVVNSSGDEIERYALENGTIGDGRLALENATVTADDELLLVTNAGLARVTLSTAVESNGDESETGLIPWDLSLSSLSLSGVIDAGTLVAPLLLPALVGLVVGYGAYRVRDDWTRDRLGISALVAAGPAITIAILSVVLSTGALLPVDLAVHGPAVGGVLLGAALAPATYYLFGVPAGVSRPTGFTVDVTVTDGSSPLDGRTKIRRERANDGSNPERQDTTIANGSGRFTVSRPGTWNVAAKHGSNQSDTVKVNKRNTSATLTIPFSATLTVTDGTNGDPIPDVTITRKDDGSTTTTDPTGTVELEPDDPGSSVEVEIAHEKYEGRTETIEFTQNGDRTIELAPRTGRARLVSRVDGVPTPSIPLRLTPRETVLRDRHGTIRLTTDGDGVASSDGLLIGQYRAEIDAPGGRDDVFDGGQSDLTVREGRSTKTAVDARFTWSLSSAQRDRIDRLRREVRSLSDHSGRDTTIPRYYGSVVLAILETVESLPEAGHRFANGETDPDAVADALLAGAGEAIDAINDAMTTKRNVDLFAACADMPDSSVDWNGSCDLETVIEWLESDTMTQRNALKDRYESVTAQVETERESVSEAAPAEEMLRHAWELGSDAGRGDEGIVTIYVALLLLEAVEDVFEHEALRERLSRTVF